MRPRTDVAASAAVSLVTLVAQHEGGAIKSLELIPLDARAGNALVSYAVYLRSFVWPARLAVFYPRPG